MRYGRIVTCRCCLNSGLLIEGTWCLRDRVRGLFCLVVFLGSVAVSLSPFEKDSLTRVELMSYEFTCFLRCPSMNLLVAKTTFPSSTSFRDKPRKLLRSEIVNGYKRVFISKSGLLLHR